MRQGGRDWFDLVAALIGGGIALLLLKISAEEILHLRLGAELVVFIAGILTIHWAAKTWDAWLRERTARRTLEKLQVGEITMEELEQKYLDTEVPCPICHRRVRRGDMTRFIDPQYCHDCWNPERAYEDLK